MKKEQRTLIRTALQYYIEMAEKERDMALELDNTDYYARYWEKQRIKAVEAKKALLKVRQKGIVESEVKTVKSKFSPKMLDRIANAWYKGHRHGTGVGRYHYKIAYNHEKHCWGIWKCHNDYLDTEIIDTFGNRKTMWEWIEELPEERFQALADQEILEGFNEYQGR